MNNYNKSVEVCKYCNIEHEVDIYPDSVLQVGLENRHCVTALLAEVKALKLTLERQDKLLITSGLFDIKKGDMINEKANEDSKEPSQKGRKIYGERYCRRQKGS